MKGYDPYFGGRIYDLSDTHALAERLAAERRAVCERSGGHRPGATVMRDDGSVTPCCAFCYADLPAVAS